MNVHAHDDRMSPSSAAKHGRQPTSSETAREEQPPILIMRMFRWTMTTTPFLLTMAASIVALSFWQSFASGQWHWFQRSGALVERIGVSGLSASARWSGHMAI